MLAPAIFLALSCAAGYAQSPESQGQAPRAFHNPGYDFCREHRTVPMTEPVLTLKGACESRPGAAAPPPGCVSSLTRAQFEKLITSLTPPNRPLSPEKRRTFATQYAKLLTFADAARAMGLENDSRVQQIFDFAKNQILTEALNQKITDEYSHPTDQQIADYYTQNSKKYRRSRWSASSSRAIAPAIQISPSRLRPKRRLMPRRSGSGGLQAKIRTSCRRKRLSTRARPVSRLQPMGARRAGSLPDAHESVFDLKSGEVSPLFSDPASFYLYKVVSVRQVPLSDAQASIRTTLQRQMVADQIQQIQKSVTPVLNEAYFGAKTAWPRAPRSRKAPKRLRSETAVRAASRQLNRARPFAGPLLAAAAMLPDAASANRLR